MRLIHAHPDSIIQKNNGKPIFVLGTAVLNRSRKQPKLICSFRVIHIAWKNMPFMTIEIPYKLIYFSCPEENLSHLRVLMVVNKTCCCRVVIIPVEALR